MRLFACTLVLMTGCLAHTFAGTGKDDVSVDSYTVPPAEKDATLSCAGAPCAAAPVDQPYRRGRSRGEFWTVYLLELGVSVGGLAVGASQNQTLPWLPVASAAFIAWLMDTGSYLGATDYGRQYDAARLAQPVVASYQGRHFSLRTTDVVPAASTERPASFSLAKAVARLPAAATPQAAAPPNAKVPKGRVAILDLKSGTKDLSADDVRYFGDMVRAATLKAAPQLEVMTRENLLVLLQASGKDLANCEGECEVDTGRRIGADAIVSGEVLKIGTRYKLTLRLHDTHDGRLLGGAVASGRTIDELDDSVGKAAMELFGSAP